MTDLLHLHDITVTYGALTALNRLHLRVPAGARHAIIGPNGAGKTSLINTITGNQQPTSGRVLFDGVDITGHPAHRRARAGIARTWQHPALPDTLTALDTVSLGVPAQPYRRRAHPPAALAAAQQALDAVGLTGHTHHRPDQLSYGRRRLLELAIALAGRPKLLLLDEPSAGLAADDLTLLTTVIRALPADVAVLLVDHNLDLVHALADTVTVLHHGRVLTTGTPEQVRHDPQTRTAYPTTATAIRTGADPAPGGDNPVLAVRSLRAAHADTDVLTDIDLDLHPGQVLAVLGRNGAGKTTLLDTLAGLHPARPGSRITLAGTPITTAPPRVRVRAGLALVPQGRRLFATLTVAEHLTLPNRPRTQPALYTRADLYDLLPALAGRRHHRPHQLSGGEQQMLAIARALAANPRLLLLDEPSEGLAPTVADQTANVIVGIAGKGVSVLLAEHNPHLAQAVAERLLVLDRGRIALDIPASALATPDTRARLDALLGVATATNTAIQHARPATVAEPSPTITGGTP